MGCVRIIADYNYSYMVLYILLTHEILSHIHIIWEKQDSYHFILSQTLWYLWFFISLHTYLMNKTYQNLLYILTLYSYCSYTKIIALNPSIDHHRKFRTLTVTVKGNKIKFLLYICVSSLLWMIHLNITIISTIIQVFNFMPTMLIT